MQKQKILLVGLVALVIIGIIIMISFSITPSGNASKENEEIVIGVIAPLSGDFATIGESVVNALEMAKEKTSGIKLIVEDEQNCNSKEALSAAEKLINVDEIDALIGPVCGASIQAVLPLSYGNSIPTIGTHVDQSFLIDYGKNTNYSSIAVGMLAGLDKYWKKLGEKAYEKSPNIAILNSLDVGAQRNVEFFLEGYTSAGGKVIFREEVQIGNKDFKTLLLKINKLDTTLVWPHLFSDDRVRFYTQKEELGTLKDKEILGDIYLELETQKYIDALGIDYLNGSLSANFKDSTSPEFKKQFKERTGIEPMIGIDGTYDALLHLKESFELCNNKKSCVIPQFKSTSYKGVSGLLYFDENGIREGEAVIKVYAHGKFSPLV